MSKNPLNKILILISHSMAQLLYLHSSEDNELIKGDILPEAYLSGCASESIACSIEKD